MFTPVSFTDVPGWASDDVGAALPPFITSCSVLDKQPKWAPACAAAHKVPVGDGAAARRFFESQFVPNKVQAADGTDVGLITGYYEPLLKGARKRHAAFQTPLYRVPDDLITVDLGSVYPELSNMRLRGKLVGNKVVPYDDRAQIDRGTPGKALLWVDDPVEAFFLEVQGSGRVWLSDTGDTVRIAYADQNGHPYKSIGRYLVEKGELTLANASAQSIKAWIAAHPERRQELFNANPSYVFFREEKLADPSIGPKGALGVPLTPERSIAVDPRYVPLGSPVFLATKQPASEEPMQRLMQAQDTGGAIRGEVRADVFFGFGPEAGEKAGKMKQPGMMWVLLPKAVNP